MIPLALLQQLGKIDAVTNRPCSFQKSCLLAFTSCDYLRVLAFECGPRHSDLFLGTWLWQRAAISLLRGDQKLRVPSYSFLPSGCCLLPTMKFLCGEVLIATSWGRLLADSLWATKSCQPSHEQVGKQILPSLVNQTSDDCSSDCHQIAAACEDFEVRT